MHERSRTQSFIRLPPLGEAGTLSLIDELKDAARSAAAGVPAVVGASLARLLDAGDELSRRIAARERSGSRADPKARAADRALDDAWGAFHMWLLGWTRLPSGAHEALADARDLHAALFPKGLSFLALDFTDEWTESKNRIDHILSHGLDATLDRLSGRVFLETIERAHRSYGEALHITEPASGAPEPDALVRRALELAHVALRQYVAHVASTVRHDDMASLDAAVTLLMPLTDRITAEDDDVASSDRAG